MINITRRRYAVMNNRGELFCGLARSFTFKKPEDIGNTPINTYMSETKAKNGFLSSWFGSKEEDFETGIYKIIIVEESIKEVEV